MGHDDGEHTRRLPALGPSPDASEGPYDATLTVLAGPQLGRVYLLERERVVLGRGEDADLRFDSAGVSRRHAELRRHGETYTIVDLDSKNGTVVAGEPVETEVSLRSGTRVVLGGRVVLRFALEDHLDRALRDQLFERATRDGLTGVPNQRYFRERLESEWPWSRRHEQPCAILSLDVDHFKLVNDTYGHLAGDEVLKELSAVIARTIRREDLLGRVGGEEFAVLCRGTAAIGALCLAERIRHAVMHHAFAWQEQPISVTVSIGIATSLDTGVGSIDALLHRADAALYAAKRAGRNCIRLIDPGDVPE